MTITRSDIVAQHFTLDEGVRAEIEALRAAGELGDGYRTEPRCHVCCEVESKDLVNKLIAAGLTNREIVESCDAINARRGNGRLIGARNVWVHRREHFNIDKPAAAVVRKIMERRAEEANIDHINGVGHAITPYAVLETVEVLGYQQLTSEGAEPPSIKETIDAAAKLHELTNRDAGARKMADLLYTMDRIISAAQKYVPEAMHEDFLAEVEGREVHHVLTERVHDKAEQVIREFTPKATMDEGDEI